MVQLLEKFEHHFYRQNLPLRQAIRLIKLHKQLDYSLTLLRLRGTGTINKKTFYFNDNIVIFLNYTYQCLALS